MGFWYRLGHTAARFIGWLLLKYRVENREALTKVSGGLLIASNHVSFLDPPLIGSAFRDPIYYFARKSLFDHPIANHILTRMNALPVNQERPELSILKQVIALLKKDEKVVIFPEGERARDGELKEEGQTGVGMMVSRANVPVLPVRLFGPEKALPRGAKRLKPHPVTLVVGEPLEFDDILGDDALDTKARYNAIAQRIMAAIRELKMSESRGE